MAYDYLTMKNKQPAEIQTPNSQSTELQQNTQMNNQITQSALPKMQGTTQSALQQVTQPIATQSTQNNVIQRDNQVTTQPSTQTNQQVQPVQSTVSQIVQPSSSSIAVRQAADFNDATVQSYWNEYQNGANINDYQAQINALTAIDNYRATKGLKPIYTANILELNNQRTQKINNQIKDYDDEIAFAMSMGDYETAEQLGRQLQDYRKMVNYQAPEIDNAYTYLQKAKYQSQWDGYINDLVLQLYNARFTYNPRRRSSLNESTTVRYQCCI